MNDKESARSCKRTMVDANVRYAAEYIKHYS